MLRTRTWPSEGAGTGASTISKCSARGMPDGLDFSLTCRFAGRWLASTSRVHPNAHILSRPDLVGLHPAVLVPQGCFQADSAMSTRWRRTSARVLAGVARWAGPSAGRGSCCDEQDADRGESEACPLHPAQPLAEDHPGQQHGDARVERG